MGDNLQIQALEKLLLLLWLHFEAFVDKKCKKVFAIYFSQVCCHHQQSLKFIIFHNLSLSP